MFKKILRKYSIKDEKGQMQATAGTKSLYHPLSWETYTSQVPNWHPQKTGHNSEGMLVSYVE